MAKVENYNGHYCESEYEYAFLAFLEEENWQYLAGNSIPRSSRREVLYADDMEQFLSKTNQDLTADEIRQIMDTIRLAGAESDFATLHKVYGWMVNGIQFTPQNGLPRMVALINFEKPENNIFRAVNQFTVEYTNNGQTETRRPRRMNAQQSMMRGSRLMFVTGAIFRICCIIVLWPAFPMV